MKLKWPNTENISPGFFSKSPVVQSIVSLTGLLMTNLLTVVAQVFSNTPIFLLQKCAFFQQININVFAVFQDRNFNVTLANNLLKFWTTGPRAIICFLLHTIKIKNENEQFLDTKYENLMMYILPIILHVLSFKQLCRIVSAFFLFIFPKM